MGWTFRPRHLRADGKRASSAIVLLFLLLHCPIRAPADISSGATPPVYSAASIVRGGSQTGGTLAPNSIATIYGTNLAWNVVSAGSADLESGDLPESLGGVTIYVNNLPSGIFYVSPGQVNFVVPYTIVGTVVSIYLVRDSTRGPIVSLPFATGAPDLFEWNGNFALAQHADGSLLTDASPAHGGEIVVLYATGLGRTNPDLFPASYSNHAAVILYLSQLQVLVGGAPCAASDIYYAGVTPGFSGLYQINIRLPLVLPSPNPTIQLWMADEASPASVQLFAN